MKKLLSLAFGMTIVLCTPVLAENIGAWNKDAIKGFTRYWTENSQGSVFNIWCHPERSSRGTLISIAIDGKAPSPGTTVKIELDRRLVKFAVDSEGYIQTACATCSDNFDYFWHQLRNSGTFRVLLADDRYAGFSVRGVRDALPGAVCPTDWNKKHKK